MKILHIAPIGVRAEGIGSVLNKLVPEQQKLGHTVRVASIRENKIYKNIDIIWIDNVGKLKLEIENYRPDIVHFHSFFRKEFILFYKLLVKESIPYIVQMHGALSDTNYKKNKWKKWVANTLFFKQFIKHANGLVFLNEQERDRCIAHKWNSNSFLLPNGCAIPNNVVLKSMPSNPIDIIYLGRISIEVKGLDILVEAISKLRNRGVNNFHISFYGNPDDADVNWLKNKLSDMSENASYYGGIYGGEKDLRLRKSDIFILTSPSEGMPMGVLEAFAYGIPSIVTPGTNMAKVIYENNAGWVCDYNSDSIADNIEKACKEYQKSCFKFHEAAFKVSDLYKWENIAKSSIFVYNSLFHNIMRKKC